MRKTQDSNNSKLPFSNISKEFVCITNPEWKLKFVADSVKDLLGYAPEELIGTNVLELIHKEDKPHLESELKSQVTTFPKIRFRTKAGEWQWLEITITKMLDNPLVAGLIINSREAVDQLEELHYSNKSCESLFDNHPNAVFELSRDGIIQKANKQVYYILGHKNENLKGTHFTRFVKKDDLPLITNALQNVENGVSQSLEFSILTSKGDSTFIASTFLPVTEGDSVNHILCIAKDINQYKQHELYISNREEQLNNIMALLPEAFYTLDANWQFSYVNDFYSEHVGISKADLLGKNIWELFPDLVDTKFYRECKQVALTGIPSSFDKYSDDSGNALSYHIFPTATGVCVHFVDVSEKKREHDRLEKISLVASKTTTCVMIMDAEKRIEWVNDAFEKVTGYSFDDVFKKFPSQVLVGEETSTITRAEINKKMESGEPFRGEILNYTKNGRQVWFDLEITPVFDKNGNLSRYISIRTDITDTKIKEKELTEVARDLFKQNRDLQQFSYIVSHNLRAPASNLMGLANILGSIKRDSEMFDETLSKILTSAQALDKVIRDMNHILTVRENRYALLKEELNIAAVCNEVLAGIQFKFRGFEFEINTDIDSDITLVANRVYLYEVLKNLFLNAVKFRKESEIFRLDVSVQRADNKIELLIKDNGIGMEMDVIKNDIFKLYKKFHAGYDGQGLGLFMVKTYLDALGGSINVDSKVGIGTTFHIKFDGYA